MGVLDEGLADKGADLTWPLHGMQPRIIRLRRHVTELEQRLTSLEQSVQSDHLSQLALGLASCHQAQEYSISHIGEKHPAIIKSPQRKKKKNLPENSGRVNEANKSPAKHKKSKNNNEKSSPVKTSGMKTENFPEAAVKKTDISNKKTTNNERNINKENQQNNNDGRDNNNNRNKSTNMNEKKSCRKDAVSNSIKVNSREKLPAADNKSSIKEQTAIINNEEVKTSQHTKKCNEVDVLKPKTKSKTPSSLHNKSSIDVRQKSNKSTMLKKKKKQKKNVLKFHINCEQPEQDGIFDVTDFERFLSERFKVNGRVNNLGQEVAIQRHQSRVTITTVDLHCSKRYLKYLTKKYLSKKCLRDLVRVVAAAAASCSSAGDEADTGSAYELRYYKFSDGDNSDHEGDSE